ncbi:hypothetical protein J1605_009140 [Eschrichtius robustus]|uniref:C3H1-type domain-containing protein n=1 Tax=Eschrichtius robustus TaxID=9764 RepID=A0AB34GY86_ESCRO|nr:hypothetical protein J1605_009140 [Eschrichtius robustus]
MRKHICPLLGLWTSSGGPPLVISACSTGRTNPAWVPFPRPCRDCSRNVRAPRPLARLSLEPVQAIRGSSSFWGTHGRSPGESRLPGSLHTAGGLRPPRPGWGVSFPAVPGGAAVGAPVEGRGCLPSGRARTAELCVSAALEAGPAWPFRGPLRRSLRSLLMMRTCALEGQCRHADVLPASGPRSGSSLALFHEPVPTSGHARVLSPPGPPAPAPRPPPGGGLQSAGRWGAGATARDPSASPPPTAEPAGGCVSRGRTPALDSCPHRARRPAQLAVHASAVSFLLVPTPVMDGRVRIRDWREERPRKEKEPETKRRLFSETFKTRICWFFTHHPDGCALPSDRCPFAHGPGELRPATTRKKKQPL